MERHRVKLKKKLLLHIDFSGFIEKKMFEFIFLTLETFGVVFLNY